MVGVILSKCLFLAFTVVMCTFWTFIVCLQMLYQFVRNGWKFFEWKERPVEPEILTKDWQHSYVKLSEVKLHYVESGSREQPLMLLLHGFPEFWYSWRFQIRDFQDKYHVVAVDQRGYNTSDKPPKISDYGIEKLSGDIAELVTALGHKSCVLAGHDWGGVVAYQVAIRYPELIDKLVIMNAPHPSAFGQLIKTDKSQLLKSWYMFFFQCPYLPELNMKTMDLQMFNFAFKHVKTITDADIEAWKYTVLQPGALTGMINWYRASLLGRFLVSDVEHASTTVQPPTLIIWGKKDKFLHEKLADLSVQRCREGTLKYVENSGHWVQQEAPEECTKLMKEFLAR